MTVRRLVLLRHGETDFNAGHRMQGQLDTALTALGRAQATEVSDTLAELNPLLIVSSDLQRAHDTAIALSERTGQTICSDRRLREMHLGHWQGLTEAEIDAIEPGARQAWRDLPTWALHGGESRTDAAKRALTLVHELIETHSHWGVRDSGRPIVLVAHNAVITALTAALLGLPLPSWPVLGGLSNASWVQLSGHSHDAADGPDDIRWRLDVWNATAQVASEVI